MYLLTYDLHKPEKDYKGLFEALESYPDRLHVLASTWLIATTNSAEQIYDKLKTQLDKDDHIIVIKVTNDKYGLLPKSSWEWINSRI